MDGNVDESRIREIDSILEERRKFENIGKVVRPYEEPLLNSMCPRMESGTTIISPEKNMEYREFMLPPTSEARVIFQLLGWLEGKIDNDVDACDAYGLKKAKAKLEELIETHMGSGLKKD